MRSQKRFGSSNALLRRVRRHANTSTLFRTADQALDLRPKPDTPLVNGERVVRAVIQPGPTSLPIGQSSDLPSVSPELFTLPSVPMPPAPIFVPTAPPMAIPNVTRPQQSAPIVQAAAAEEGHDPNWRRLKNIVHRHEEKEARKEARNEVPKTTATAEPSNSKVVRAIHTAESPDTAVTEHKAPLESVWPVQPVWPVQSELAQRKQIDTSPPPQPSVSSPPVSPNPVKGERIRAKLDKVTAGRSTDSSIELHLPRRPRPHPVTQSQETAVPVRRRRKPTTQRKPTSKPVTVQTEIGPLPADMWQLLGQEPPLPSDSGAAESPAENDADDKGVIMRAVDTAESSQPTSLPAPPMQRQPEPTPALSASPTIAPTSLVQGYPEPPASSSEPAATVEGSVGETTDRVMRAIVTAESPTETISKTTVQEPAESLTKSPLPPTITGESVSSRPIKQTAVPTPTPSVQRRSEPIPTTPEPAPTVEDIAGDDVADRVMRVISTVEAPVERIVKSPVQASPTATAIKSDERVLSQPTTDITETAVSTATTPIQRQLNPSPDEPSAPEVAPVVEEGASDDSTEDATESVMRAIAVAEAKPQLSPVAAKPTSPPSATAVTETAEPITVKPPIQRQSKPAPIIQDKTVKIAKSTNMQIMRAITASESPSETKTEAPTTRPQPAAVISETAVPTPTQPVQRQPKPAHAEVSTLEVAAKTEGVTGTADVDNRVMRAITAVEAPAELPTPHPYPAVVKTEPAVSTPTPPAQPQPEPSDAEQPVSEPSAKAEGVTEKGVDGGDRIMRAIAAAEAPTLPERPAAARDVYESAPSLSTPTTQETAVPIQPFDLSPTDSHRPPANFHHPPTDSYRPPTDSYRPPTDSHRPPTDSHRPPTDSYRPPASSQAVMRTIAAAESPTETTAPPVTKMPNPAPQVRRTAVSPTTAPGPAAPLSEALAADKWQVTKSPPSPAITVAASTDTLKRAIAATESPAKPAPPLPDTKMEMETAVAPIMPMPSPVIQRTEAETAAAPISPSEGAEDVSETEAAQVDVDELARQVYSKLRRRLSVERERERGRL